MNVVIIIGWICIIYGIATAILREIVPAKLLKYAAFQQRYGAKRGKWLHIIAYTLVPLGFGIFLLIY
jgi:hypothetical protein